MTMKLEQAARQIIVDWDSGIHLYEAITALRKALAEQAEQSQLADATLEPVAWFVQYKNRHEFVFGSKPESIVDGVVEPLYAAPVRTKDLTDEEIEDAVGWTMTEQSILDCRAVIAADREKNK